MTKDEFIAEVEKQLLGALLKGYVTKEQDPSQLFRIMCVETKLLREKAGDIYEKHWPKHGIASSQTASDKTTGYITTDKAPAVVNGANGHTAPLTRKT